MRAKSERRPSATGTVWITPTSGRASISRTSADQRLAAHHAVGVEHDHVAVARGPSAGRSRRRSRSCARRARGGAGRRPGRSRPRRAAPVEPRLLLVHPGARVGAVGEHEEVEVLERRRRARASDRSRAARRRRGRPAPRRSASRSRCASPGRSARPASTLASIEKRSRRRSSSRKPSTAVQKPIEIHAKSAPKKIAIASSSGVSPLWGSTLVMKPPATMLGATTSSASSRRRRRATRTQASRRRRSRGARRRARPRRSRSPGALARTMRRRSPCRSSRCATKLRALERRHGADPLGPRDRRPLRAALGGQRASGRRAARRPRCARAGTACSAMPLRGAACAEQDLAQHAHRLGDGVGALPGRARDRGLRRRGARARRASSRRSRAPRGRPRRGAARPPSPARAGRRAPRGCDPAARPAARGPPRPGDDVRSRGAHGTRR